MPEESTFQNNSVFFIDVDKIHPNPYQPRKEFDNDRLADLAESIRMYGLLQPLTVTRKEVVKEDGGLTTEYELIAGERRLRASKLIGLKEIPALIRSKDDDARTKLELAIIENLQREDLNSIDRAKAFEQLANEFGFKHGEIAKKVGKSREYVSNTIRLLLLPPEMQQALSDKQISEGHTRPLLMLSDRPEEQQTLFKEILLKKMTVRDAEKISRKIATDKVRKHDRKFNQDIVDLEQEVGTALGTRVHIQPKEKGGKIEIDYFSEDDLRAILQKMSSGSDELPSDVIVDGIEDIAAATPLAMNGNVEPAQQEVPLVPTQTPEPAPVPTPPVVSAPEPVVQTPSYSPDPVQEQVTPEPVAQEPPQEPIQTFGTFENAEVSETPDIQKVEDQLGAMGIEVEEPVEQTAVDSSLMEPIEGDYNLAKDIVIEGTPDPVESNPVIDTPGQNPTPELSDDDDVTLKDFTI